MRKGLTEIVFILDKSGSMSGLEDDSIGGFHSLIGNQREIDGECIVSLVLFNQFSKVILDRVDIDKVRPLTRQEYYVGGSTALLDAIGDAIHHNGNVHKYTREEDRPEHTFIIITTDGMENASQRYSFKMIKQMIEHQKEKYHWQFQFLGANIDVHEVGSQMGLRDDECTKYESTSKGVWKSYDMMNANISVSRVNNRKTK